MSVLESVHSAVGRFVSGESIWERDWDVLCVLDGCRVDTLEQFYDCDSYRSVASESPNWLKRTFGDRDLGTVGYISGNPFATRLDGDRFGYFHVEPVESVDGVQTVSPRSLAERAVAVWANRDELGVDTLIVHWMQPHVPFRSRPEWFDKFAGTEVWGSRAWRRIGDDIDRAEWMAAYEDNLKWVIDDGVEPLREQVTGTVGVTADHGNAAGEWGIYGHPSEVAVPAARRVPWHSFEADGEASADDIDLESRQLSTAERDKQLRALGYTS